MGNPFDLTGRVALVTGGNGGIGFGIAEGLAQAGAAVAIAGRNAAKNSEALAALEAKGAKAMAIEADVSDEASVAHMTGSVSARFGRIDILVANAGINIRKPPEDYTLAEWHQIINVNLTSLFLCANAVCPSSRRRVAARSSRSARWRRSSGVPSSDPMPPAKERWCSSPNRLRLPGPNMACR